MQAGMLTCPFYLDQGQVLCLWPQMDLLSYPFHKVKKYLGQNQVLFRSFKNSILTKKIIALLFLENTFKIRTSFFDSIDRKDNFLSLSHFNRVKRKKSCSLWQEMFQKRFQKDRSVFSQKVRYFPGPFHTQKMDLGQVLVHRKWT